MSLIPTIYSSTDPGAPALAGQPGSLTTLLDAILVDGYGSGPSAKLGLGWTREFTATNKRVYRNDPILGSGTYLRVDDTAAVGNARHAWIRAFESMSSIDAGTNPNPPTAPVAEGALWAKSATLDGTARPWWAIGNATALYLFISSTTNDPTICSPHIAGDLDSRLPADNGNFVLESSKLSSWTGAAGDMLSHLFRATNAFSGAVGSGNGGFGYIMRPASMLPAAAIVANISDDHGANSTTSAFGGGGAPYPDPVGSGLLVKPVSVKEGAYMLRGFLPGVLVPQHVTPFNDLQVIEGLEDLDGISVIAKSFRSMHLSNAGYQGQVLFIIGKEW